MSEQLDHYSTNFSSEKFPILLITDQVNSPANLGSLFRLADAFHIEKIIFCGIEEEVINSNRLKRTARSTQNNVAFQFEDSIETVIEHLQQQKIEIFALEITNDSIPVEEIQLQENKKIALIIGDENLGVNQDLLKKTSANLHIKMYGNNSSMNVAQATGIALYEITKKLSSFPQK